MSATKPKLSRTMSATARLQTPPELQKKLREQVVKERRKRVSSARQNREKQESSKKVFPRHGADPRERFKTVYTNDFEGTYVPPTEGRPTSPTRRNNPHPAKQFMVWRVPTREIGAPQAEGLMRDAQISFQRNYSMDEDSEFDDLESSFGRMKLAPPKPSSHDYGAYLRERRELAKPQFMDQAAVTQAAMGQPAHRPMRRDVLSRTLRDGNESAMAEWLQTANSHEQQAVLKMLRAAENAQVHETIGEVMQPPAAKAVQKWLKRADEHEREVAVRLFSSMGTRQRRYSEPALRPLSRQSLPPAPMGQPHLVDQRLDGSLGQSGSKPWPAALWHLKPVRDPPPKIYHRGSLFGMVRGDTSHYKIHPDWPEYQADVVH